jgi:hypothetical protein
MRVVAQYKKSLLVSHSLVAAVMCGAIQTASAFSINVENPDFDIRWDNTVRYNLGVRARNCDINLCGNNAGAGDVTAYQSDRKFAKAGNVVMDRIDVLSEFDFVYKRDSGFRVSAAAWYDDAYTNKVAGDSALDASGVGQGAGRTGGAYSDYTKRWNRGPSAQFLDAFVFTKVNLGDVPINVKLGKHTNYWGESLFSFVGGVAYQQGPVDIRKAFATPGVSAKEVFLPVNQASFSAAVTPELRLLGQYFLDWKYSPLPDGGTYFGLADGVSMGGGTVFGAPTNISVRPNHRVGDFGLGAKWTPDWLDGTAGFFYREYTNTFPQLVLSSVAPLGFGLDYASTKREKMFAFTLSKQIWGISWGMDLTYRPDAVLMATPFGTYAPPSAAPATWVPTGNLATGLVNAMALINKTPLFDMAVLMAELNYSRLDKVTANNANFFGEGYGCTDSANPTWHACPTKDAWGVAVMFEPKWFQVFSGVDLSMPLFYSIGLKGNSPVVFGDNQGQGSWSVGVAADVEAKYNFALKYNGFNVRHRNDQLGAGGDINTALGKFWDRDSVSLTFKTSF